MILAVAFAAALSAASSEDLVQQLARQPRASGLIDVSAFADKAMVRAVRPAPCASRSFQKWPEAGCVRATRQAPVRE